MLYSRSLSVIYCIYSSVCTSIPISRFISPLPPPQASIPDDWEGLELRAVAHSLSFCFTALLSVWYWDTLTNVVGEQAGFVPESLTRV